MKKIIIILIFISTIYPQHSQNQNWTKEDKEVVTQAVYSNAVFIMFNYLNTPTSEERDILEVYFNVCFPLFFDQTISANQVIEISNKALEGFSLNFPLEVDEWASYPITEMMNLSSLEHLVGTEVELSKNQEFLTMAAYNTMYSYINGMDEKYLPAFKKVKKGKSFSSVKLSGRFGWMNVNIYGYKDNNHLERLKAEFSEKLYKNRSSHGGSEKNQKNQNNGINLTL